MIYKRRSHTEEALRWLEGKTIQSIKHESQCLDSRPVFSIYFTDGKMFRCYPIAWDAPANSEPPTAELIKVLTDEDGKPVVPMQIVRTEKDTEDLCRDR